MDSLKIADREFEIGEPNALHLLRIAQVVGNVGTRAEKVAANLGRGLWQRLGGGENPAPDTAQADLLNSLFPFLAALTEDDLLALMAALLQFDDAADGVRWLKKHPPRLTDVVQAVVLNLQFTDQIVAAIQNFTTLASTLRLARLPETG